jgi:hypothetical protein
MRVCFGKSGSLDDLARKIACDSAFVFIVFHPADRCWASHYLQLK